MGSDPQNRSLPRADPVFRAPTFGSEWKKNPRILAAVAVGRGVGLCALEPSLRRVTSQAVQSTCGTSLAHVLKATSSERYVAH